MNGTKCMLTDVNLSKALGFANRRSTVLLALVEAQPRVFGVAVSQVVDLDVHAPRSVGGLVPRG